MEWPWMENFLTRRLLPEESRGKVCFGTKIPWSSGARQSQWIHTLLKELKSDLNGPEASKRIVWRPSFWKPGWKARKLSCAVFLNKRLRWSNFPKFCCLSSSNQKNNVAICPKASLMLEFRGENCKPQVDRHLSIDLLACLFHRSLSALVIYSLHLLPNYKLPYIMNELFALIGLCLFSYKSLKIERIILGCTRCVVR